MSMIKVKDLPSEGEMLFKEISEDERRRIYKNFPFPAIRNRTLLELRERGAKIKGLAELSGFTRAHVERIIRKEREIKAAESLIKKRR
jgi:hypothetical protein